MRAYSPCHTLTRILGVSSNTTLTMSEKNVLEKLDSLPKIRQFDAFPKVRFASHRLRRLFACFPSSLPSFFPSFLFLSFPERGKHD